MRRFPLSSRQLTLLVLGTVGAMLTFIAGCYAVACAWGVC